MTSPFIIIWIFPEIFLSDFLGQFSRFSEFVRDIERIESVSDYLNSRPELIDVKVAPKLVINGKAHPTGINKT